MGMYFNSAQTVKMVARVNIAFGPKAGGGEIEQRRSKKGWFKKGGASRQKLKLSASMLKIEPDQNDDPNGTIQKKWHDWLDGLEATPSQSLDPVPIPPKLCPPKTGPFDSKAGIEVGSLIYQGLNDPGCEEIVFVVLPDSAISVDQPQTYGTANAYSLIVTVRTVEVTTLRARLRRIARARRQRQARAKNKKKD